MSSVQKKIHAFLKFHIGSGVIFWLFTLTIVVLIFVVAENTYTLTRIALVEKEMPRIEQDLSDEMTAALVKTKAMVAEHVIDAYIAHDDLINTSNILKDLAKKYDFSGMVAVNEEGVVLARLASPRIGDYVFQTTPWGRAAANGQTVVMVGEGRNFPLLISSAVPIMQNQKVAGALFGSYILDNQYAQTFKKKYLHTDEEVVFYSNKTGLTGTSYSDIETERLLKIYTDQASDAVRQTQSGLLAEQLRIGNTTFHVLNIKLANPNGTVGGMLILIPIGTTFTYIVASILGIILSLATILIRRGKHKSTRRQLALSAIILIIFVTGNTLVFTWIVNQHLYTLLKPSGVIYNSTIAFSPESDLFQEPAEQRIALTITTGGEAINAAQATVTFDPKALRIEDILFTNSFCDQNFIIEKEIDLARGVVSVACGTPSGFTGSEAILAELMVQPLRVGVTNLHFGADTAVSANDGLGTNVLRTMTDGSYQIFTSDPKKQSDQILLFSYSHPNQVRWYNQKDVHIDWVQPDSYKDYLYTFNQDANAMPNGTLHTIKTSIDLTAPTDGIYYFHITPRKQDHVGQTSRYTILIDTTPPETPEIKSSATTVHAGDIVRLQFLDHGDTGSGLQKNFYVRFDNGIWFPTLSQLDTTFEPGVHTVSLRVFDNAGNFSDTSTVITVQ